MHKARKCISQVASPIQPVERGYSPWTWREVEYLRMHRTDGADLIAHALGRTVPSVKAKAHVLGLSLMYLPGDTCPVCGENPIREGTAAARHTMCISCWEKRKANATRERALEEGVKREYDRERQRKRRGFDG